MDKKVIEPVVIKQEAEDNIRIEKRSTRTCISQIEVCGWKENKVSVDDATRTEVAKAICPKYQELENQNAKLLEALRAFSEKSKIQLQVIDDLIVKTDEKKEPEFLQTLVTVRRFVSATFTESNNALRLTNET